MLDSIHNKVAASNTQTHLGLLVCGSTGVAESKRQVPHLFEAVFTDDSCQIRREKVDLEVRAVVHLRVRRLATSRCPARGKRNSGQVTPSKSFTKNSAQRQKPRPRLLQTSGCERTLSMRVVHARLDLAFGPCHLFGAAKQNNQQERGHHIFTLPCCGYVHEFTQLSHASGASRIFRHVCDHVYLLVCFSSYDWNPDIEHTAWCIRPRNLSKPCTPRCSDRARSGGLRCAPNQPWLRRIVPYL
jgi:hypothetical protein